MWFGTLPHNNHHWWRRTHLYNNQKSPPTIPNPQNPNPRISHNPNPWKLNNHHYTTLMTHKSPCRWPTSISPQHWCPRRCPRWSESFKVGFDFRCKRREGMGWGRANRKDVEKGNVRKRERRRGLEVEGLRKYFLVLTFNYSVCKNF